MTSSPSAATPRRSNRSPPRVGAEHGRIVTRAIDVSDPANARSVVELAQTSFGGIDVLVNNAGHVAVGPLSAQSDDALRAQFGTHVIGPIALVREALPLLRASRGHVFMVGSGVARVPSPGWAPIRPRKRRRVRPRRSCAASCGPTGSR